MEVAYTHFDLIGHNGGEHTRFDIKRMNKRVTRKLLFKRLKSMARTEFILFMH